jgi:energy-coupling factor transporter ATP-binding protein EcfA2
MIDTTNLAKEYGARVLFEDVTLQLGAGSRYGLVGANGSGKTTFLRLLAGDEEPSHGTFNLAKRARLGVLRQDRFLDDDAIIVDLAMRGDAVVWEALAEQKRIVEECQTDPGRMGRVGVAGLCPVEPERGKVWKPSQGFHISWVCSAARPGAPSSARGVLSPSDASCWPGRCRGQRSPGVE